MTRSGLVLVAEVPAAAAAPASPLIAKPEASRDTSTNLTVKFERSFADEIDVALRRLKSVALQLRDDSKFAGKR